MTHMSVLCREEIRDRQISHYFWSGQVILRRPPSMDFSFHTISGDYAGTGSGFWQKPTFLDESADVVRVMTIHKSKRSGISYLLCMRPGEAVQSDGCQSIDSDGCGAWYWCRLHRPLSCAPEGRQCVKM